MGEGWVGGRECSGIRPPPPHSLLPKPNPPGNLQKGVRVMYLEVPRVIPGVIPFAAVEKSGSHHKKSAV